MKKSYLKIQLLAFVITSLLLSSCDTVGDNEEVKDEFPEKKIKFEQATQMSKKFKKDMVYYFAIADAYENLMDELDSLSQTKERDPKQHTNVNLSAGEYSELLTKLKENVSKNIESEAISDEIGNQKFVMSVSSWYSLKELDNYIKYSKKVAQENGNTMDGIRIYIGVVPAEEGYRKDRWNHLTTFLSPTGTENTQTGSFISTSFYAKKDLVQPGEDYGGEGEPPSHTHPQ